MAFRMYNGTLLHICLKGSNDMVRCFYCGGKLRCWQANDDVWTEHARLFPLCPYVRNKKGSAFITHVQKTDNEVLHYCL